jgi:pimeloyl-ACP methyl ester carboxylesterase
MGLVALLSLLYLSCKQHDSADTALTATPDAEIIGTWRRGHGSLLGPFRVDWTYEFLSDGSVGVAGRWWQIGPKRFKASIDVEGTIYLDIAGDCATAWRTPSAAAVKPAFWLTRVGSDVDCSPHPPSSHYVHQAAKNSAVIVFVHGLFGHSRSTWTNEETQAYWPALIAEDEAFIGYNVFAVEYPSPFLRRSYMIDELVDHVRLVLSDAGVLGYESIVFVAHSLGGVVVRGLLTKYRNVVPKTRFAYFIATPTTGSDLARIGRMISRNPQLGDLLPITENGYLASLQSTWLAARLGVRSYCAYETLTTFGALVVPRESATNLCTERLDPMNANHISIAKPAGREDAAYIAFREAFREVRGQVH